MDRRPFEGLEVLRRPWASRAGDSEICRGKNGLGLIRLRVRENACQRACLNGMPPARARLEGGVLELLYPFGEGVSLREWLFERTPNLGARRDACLSILTQCIADRVPPCVLALSAREENLRFSGAGVRLLYLADWGAWQKGIGAADAVRAVAELCREVLTRRLPPGPVPPVELRLFLWRTEEEDYTDWAKLQRDLSALPDAPDTLEQAGRRLLSELWKKTERFRKPLFCVMTAAALALALLSLVAEGTRRRNERAGLWPGMTKAAGQEWGKSHERTPEEAPGTVRKGGAVPAAEEGPGAAGPHPAGLPGPGDGLERLAHPRLPPNTGGQCLLHAGGRGRALYGALQ